MVAGTPGTIANFWEVISVKGQPRSTRPAHLISNL